MRFLVNFLLISITMVIAVYFSLPTPEFPPPPPNSLQSTEPADTESVYRRSYFTNYSRTEILNYYWNNFNSSIIQYRLNYPPEESYTYIRDQTPSSWLEEIVHPGKESLFVNGFYPTKPTEQININGVHYVNKITVHYFPSKLISRFTVLFLSVICIYLLKKEYAQI
jgi:hypothetical protein